MKIDDAVAYGEQFERATGSLRFEGAGVRLDRIEMAKGPGSITGAAYIEWDGNYSFNGDGRRIPIEQMQAMTFPRTPLSGLLEFTASGAGNFEAPRYEVRGRVADLFAGEEGIGQVTGRLSVRGELLTLEIEGASPRLAVSGSGRIALTPQADAELTFRFADTSLDPYVRFFEPRLSPFTTAVASGTLRVVGELFDVEHLRVDGRVESVALGLFDYRLRNDGPIELALDQNVVRIGRMRLVGDGTALDLAGEVRLGDERIALRATGDANLGILQGFFRNLRSSGVARVVAEAAGPLREPVFSGSAVVTDGRVRHFALPHGLEAINGRISFDAGGVRMDDVTARLGGGDVRFGGRIAMKGYVPSEFGLTASGERMRLRYPEGFRSEIDADLALRGPIADPILSGTVAVRDAVFSRRFDWSPELLGTFTSQSGSIAPPEGSLPLRYDLRITAPSTLRLENNLAQIVSSADLTLSGTYDKPVLFGRAEIERGEVLFEGNRYRVTRGTIDFTNPTRIQPFFDIEAETRVRVPGQTYRVTFRATGTTDRIVPEFSSDPPLPALDVLSLLLGEVYDPLDAEIQALESRRRSEQTLIAGAARLLTSPISSGVGRAVEQTLGVDSVQITPLANTTTTQSLNPAARLTIGKRISRRAFLTYSRALNAAYNEQIILLEYDQSDRWSWVLSQNGDQTYALDFRVRHIF
jgi:autotransporter translocation and assembly factor TamB